MREVLGSKQPPVCRKFSRDDSFELLFERNFDLSRALFAGKIEEAECTSSWKPFVSACARMTQQPQVCGQHRVTIFIEKKSINKNS